MKKTNNKGFSLVELIIVIAIMAILVGVLAPQYMKYVEKSRISADKDLADSVYNACTTASADPDNASSEPSANSSVSVTAGTDWGDDVLDTLGVTSFSDVEAKLKSKAYKGQSINISTDSQGNFVVTVTDQVGTYGNLQIPE
jgi:prepilin-type N-terminal cleavage/methylation domain-containing protein